MRRVALILVGAAIVTLTVRLVTGFGPSDTPPTVPEAPPGPLAVGSTAPGFELQDQDGKVVAVGGPSASWTIVTFYRVASSPW